MTFQVDIWLRGTDVATTQTIEGIPHPPSGWNDHDVRLVLEAMLRAMHRQKHASDQPYVSLRGLSWIVNPYDDGGVVIAIEITLGAAVAGPFDIDKSVLETMIARVLKAQPAPPSTESSTIH
jgi:hypothetical protein